MTRKLINILSTAYKDIKRNKPIAFSSIGVMTLVFIVFSIFSGFAFMATKVLNYVETRAHLEVFFNTDVPEEKILEIKQLLENTGKTIYVEYTSQEDAAEFMRLRHSDNPLIIEAITPEVLPASLSIKAKKIDYVQELNTTLESQDSDNTLIYKISYNEDTTNLLKDLLFWVRLIGAVLFVVSVTVIFLVSLITTELSIKFREDEISIMQLVGGDKWYIRAPFVFQGALFGILGALISAVILIGTGALFYFLKDQSPTLTFLSNFFSDLDWPDINLPFIALFLLTEIILGCFVGTINSIVAVIRHLK